MVKLNLEKIKKLEREYNGNQIALNTLQLMLDTVMSPNYAIADQNQAPYNLAKDTLSQLGVIDEVDDKKIAKPLNS